MKYNYLLGMSFDEFRKWFNSRFSLDVDNHFCGLSRICLSVRDFEHFVWKLVKFLNHSLSGNPRYSFVSFKFNNHIVKCYDR